MDDLSYLRSFVCVVDEGSFSAAARSLGVTPSSVSRQISQLETDLGARLFHRTTRRQSLTESGEIYYQHAGRLVADLEEARLAVARLTDTPSGSLHITAEADFVLAFVAPILREFLDRYPAVRIRLSMSAGIVDLVESGIDLAIRMGHLADSSLIARKIGTSRSVVCASSTYLERYGSPEHPLDLEAHRCLSFRTEPRKVTWAFQAPTGDLDVLISGPLKANSLVLLRDAALAAIGIIMIPTWMIRSELESGQLVPLLEDFPLNPPSTPVHAVFAHRRHLAPKVRVFVDFLSEQMEKL